LKSFQKRGAQVVAISVDPIDESQELSDDLGLTFPLLYDPEMKIIRAYGVEDPGNEISWPAIFVVDTEGRVAWRNVVDNYKVRPTTAEVLSAVDGAAKPSDSPQK